MAASKPASASAVPTPTVFAAWLGRLPTWARLGLAATGSLMMALGAPPHGLNTLIWLGFVPLLVVLRLAPRRPPRRVFAYGVLGGVCTGLVGFPWIAELLVRFAEVPWLVGALGLGLFSLWMALPFGLWAVAVVWGPNRGWRRIAWPIASWVAIADLWPQLFPYTPLIGFSEVPAWMQAAELAGVPALSAQVVALGVLATDALIGPPTPVGNARRWRMVRAALALAIPVLATVGGHWRLGTIDAEIASARRVRVGLVQPNNALMTHNARGRMRRLHTMSAAAQAEGAQLVVWPEAGAFPYSIQRPFTRDGGRRHRRIMRGFRLPTIFGAGTHAPGEAWERNSVFNLAIDGEVRGRFDKVILVPIGEYVPVIDPLWLRRRVPAVSHNIAGEGPVRFEVQPAPSEDRPNPGPAFFAGPLVCYEDIFPNFARQVAGQSGGIELFVNVTIDTWFGDTAEPWEHLALAQLRSVEHRIPMVRSVAAGVTAAVDAGGRLVAHLPVTAPLAGSPVAPQRLVTDVALTRNTAARPTIYARFGWLAPWLCQAWGLLVLGAGLLARVRRKPYKQPATVSATPAEPPHLAPDDGDKPK